MAYAIINICGISFTIRYQIHDNGWLEWALQPEKTIQLTERERFQETQLKMHYSGLVRDLVFEYDHYNDYADAAAAAYEAELREVA